MSIEQQKIEDLVVIILYVMLVKEDIFRVSLSLSLSLSFLQSSQPNTVSDVEHLGKAARVI